MSFNIRNQVFLQSQYVRRLRSYLSQYTPKNANYTIINFRCPFCMDSTRSKIKKRGYLYVKTGGYIFHCHNCSRTMTFENFLQKINGSLHDEYKLEKFREFKETEAEPIPVDTSIATFRAKTELLNGLICINKLFADHPARKYVEDRRLPLQTHKLLYYTDNFFRWINQKSPDKLVDCDKSEGADHRLVIPFFSADGEVFACQGRTIANSEVRYITYKVDARPKLYGAERCDTNQLHYILEGPLDSLFIPNAMAMAGSDIDYKLFDPNLAVFSMDNEPRNPEVVQLYRKIIKAGNKLVIWPEYVQQKDINDMIVKGDLTIEQLCRIMSEHTFSGLEAELKLNMWKKVK